MTSLADNRQSIPSSTPTESELGADPKETFYSAGRTDRRRGGLGFLGLAAFLLDGAFLFLFMAVMNWWREPKDGPESLLFFLLPLALLTGCLFLIDGYKIRPKGRSSGYATQHVLAVGIALLLTLFISYVVFHQWATGTARRGNIAISFLAFLPVSLFYRKMFFDYAKKLGRRSVIFYLGVQTPTHKFSVECAKRPELGRVVYVISGEPDEGSETGNDFEKLSLALFEKYRSKIGAVVCAEGIGQYSTEIVQLLMDLRFCSVPVFTVESFYEERLRKIPASVISPEWLFKEGFRVAHDPVYLHIKRLSDICLAGFGLLLTVPIFFAVALAVKLTAPKGPVFFRQSRVGLNNQVFQVYKFRSMKVGSERGNVYTQDNDPRLTLIGGFLRKSRLDELPQLWNVLKGDMSLIGPRAEWNKLVCDYEKAIPYYHFRHMVKPGITGWAQVNYPYGANLADTVEKLEYDLYYIRHFSFILDASIVLKTIHTMLFGKGK